MKKRKHILLSAILLIILFLAIACIIYIKGRTTMDKIFFAAATYNFKTFNQVPELDPVSNEDTAQFENFGGMSIRYKEEYLSNGITAKLFIPAEEKQKNIQIHATMDISNTTIIIMDITYNDTQHTLTYEPISVSYSHKDTLLVEHYFDSESIMRFLWENDVTKQDISDFQDYILYDVVVKTWTDAHNEDFEKEREKVERMTKIDNTFSFPE